MHFWVFELGHVHVHVQALAVAILFWASSEFEPFLSVRPDQKKHMHSTFLSLFFSLRRSTRAKIRKGIYYSLHIVQWWSFNGEAYSFGEHECFTLPRCVQNLRLISLNPAFSLPSTFKGKRWRNIFRDVLWYRVWNGASRFKRIHS